MWLRIFSLAFLPIVCSEQKGSAVSGNGRSVKGK